MIPEGFDYIACRSLDDASTALRDHEEAKLLAGGHSLLPLMRMRLAAPEVLVDISRVEELGYVRDDGEHLAVGAGTRHQTLATDATLRSHVPILADVAAVVGDPQVRHRGTLGGSLAHADPAADLPAVALALEATFVIASSDGSTREVPASDFFVGFWETVLEDDDILTEVRFPRFGTAPHAYEKFRERSQDWAIVGAAVVLGDDPRVGLVNMGQRPVRATQVEAALRDGASAREASELAPEGTDPPSDATADADYRRHLAKVLVRRAIEAASA